MSEEHAGGNRELRQALREIRAAVIPMVDNIHRDVHGIRRDFRDAIERSQAALLNKLSLIDAKLDKIGTGGVTPEDQARIDALMADGAKIVADVKALAGTLKSVDEQTTARSQ